MSEMGTGGGGNITEKSAAEAADSKTKEKRRVKKEEKKPESAEVMCRPSAVQLRLTANNAIPLIPLTRLTQH